MRILISLSLATVLRVYLDDGQIIHGTRYLTGALGPVMLPLKEAYWVMKALRDNESWPIQVIGNDTYLVVETDTIS